IWVLKPIRHFSILRNEVNHREWKPMQRHTLGLRDVGYLIRADVAVRREVEVDPAKYRDQFRRRAARGQCFHRPFLGCREFPAAFSLPTSDESPIAHTEELGRMLFDLEFTPGEGPVIRWGHSPNESDSPGARFIERGSLRPRFFQARLEQ